MGAGLDPIPTSAGAPVPTTFVWSDDLLRYDFGPTHPMHPVRLRLAVSLIRAFGLFDAPGVLVRPPDTVDTAELARVHRRDYIAAVQAAREDAAHGLGPPDNPVFPGMHDSGARVAGATLAAARAIVDGSTPRAVSLAGGLHHAMPDRASGFCVYNDLALGIAHLLDSGVSRIAYVDTDVHHGDGVQEMFCDDPRVLTVSLHQDPRTLWPGTGYPTEIGDARAPGTVVNVALPPRTTDAGWLRAFHAVVPPVLHAFQPQVLVTQHGCDTHRADPLGGLMLSVDGQRAAALALAELAARLCGDRWLAAGGGGYALLDVVPRSWAHLTAIVAGRPLPVSMVLPPQWLAERAAALAVEAGGEMEQAPATMGDGAPAGYRDWAEGHDPGDPVDAAILAVRRAAFPALGLPPDS